MHTKTSCLLPGYCFLIATLLLLTLFKPVFASNENKITIAFRFDDYSATSNTLLEKNLINAFDKNGLSITIGVIPNIMTGDYHQSDGDSYETLPENKKDILRNAYFKGVIEVALHGYTHQRNKVSQTMSEFAGLEYEKQYDLLKTGQTMLEEIIHAPVTTFIPPWNSYDNNTLKALDALDFKTISADFNGTYNTTTPLQFLPFTCDLAGFKSTLEHAEKRKGNSPLIVVMIHQYDFLEISSERGSYYFQEFENLLHELALRNDLVLTDLAGVENYYQNIYAPKYNQLVTTKKLFLKAFPVQLVAPPNLYMSDTFLLEQKLFVYLYLYLIPLILAFAFYFILQRIWVRRNMQIPFTGIITLLLFTSIFIFTRLNPGGYKITLILQILSGFFLALTILRYRRNKTVSY